MADDNAKELHKRCERLFEKKRPLDSLNQEIALNFYLERADFIEDHQWGGEFALHSFDSTPFLVRRDLCNSFGSMLRPRGQPWFKATIGDEEAMEEPRMQRACDEITTIMRRHMYKRQAQFGRGTKECDHDYGTFGNGILWVGVSRNRTGLLYRCFHPRDVVWAEGPDGEINEGGCVFRKFKMSARNIKAMWPEAELHQSVKDALEKDSDREFTICHAMMPIDEYKYYKAKPIPGVEWASVYYDHDNCSLLEENWSHEFRYVIPRWQTISGSPYAVSPAAVVSLPDGRGLQTMARVLLEAGEKSVDPPMVATDGAIIGGINLYSGGVTWKEKDYNEKEGAALEPLLLGKQVALGVDLLQLAKFSLKDCWYLTKLNMPPQSKTAYEASLINEEYVRANIPLFEPIETTYNAPLLSLTADILDRLGAFDHILGPKERRGEGDGEELDFEFSNPLQDAIERNKANQASIVMGVAAGFEQVEPGVTKAALDIPYIINDVRGGSGAPAKWSRDPKVVEEAQAQQMEQNNILSGLAEAEQAAQVVKTGSEAALNLQDTGLLGGAPVEDAGLYAPV